MHVRPTRVFVHAGFHKTGTTSFQAFVENNRARHPRDFAFYGKTNKTCAALHDVLVAYHRAPAPHRRRFVRDAIETLAAEIAKDGAARALVSLESLCGLMPRPGGALVYPHAAEILRLLEDALDGGLACVFLSTRARMAWLKSVYKHLVKSRGLNIGFVDFLAAEKFRGFDWADVVARVSADLACEVRVAPLEHDVATHFGPGAAFLRHVGFAEEELAGWGPPLRRNTGLSDRTIAALQTAPLKLMPAQVRKRLAKVIDGRWKAADGDGA